MKIIIIKDENDIEECDIAILSDVKLQDEVKKFAGFILLPGENPSDDVIERLLDFEVFCTIVERSSDPIVIHNGEKNTIRKSKSVGIHQSGGP
ncbi:hypothetical protein [Archaeoglobus neptunius]|uniref:hypothetical protein n=1 Tax=Archaeoglobus neptunius TaxID=2798580 RepID=UPI0019296EC3|nr:hypothetical protein [Archaeoglobus neptunius]